MPNVTQRIERLAAVSAIAKEVDRAGFGRTALMKCAYFLQTLKKVPLGYHFSLYTYGPYDSDVLQDLDYAQKLGALNVSLVSYSTGYGYSIQIGPNADAVFARAESFLEQYRDEIKGIATEFGQKSAVDLELDSAVVFISRSPELLRSDNKLDEIVDHVKAIKPRFKEDEIRHAAQELISAGHVTA